LKIWDMESKEIISTINTDSATMSLKVMEMDIYNCIVTAGGGIGETKVWQECFERCEKYA